MQLDYYDIKFWNFEHFEKIIIFIYTFYLQSYIIKVYDLLNNLEGIIIMILFEDTRLRIKAKVLSEE